ncbi:hypothetical protein ADIS_0268 [Lunatimonas lonarensis]|uniref:Uncharacterized protein n=1 Tax=Lunatimonas lonarensis TaxID=1232681 RepID=R7ZYY9_9BACT|nr:hypothetical protein [Lunatimonas lonarensis]EON79263.1 hypothetical protein ADIS_0268 [Lunatimonas lonarensis]
MNSKDSNYRLVREELAGLLLEKRREVNEEMDFRYILAGGNVIY